MEEQLRKAFEEVTTKNVTMNVDYSKKTREIVNELSEKIERLQNIVLSRNEQIDQMQIQIAQLLQTKFNGGT